MFSRLNFAQIAVRINEVTPTGASWNVSYGILNLTHRDGHENPTLLKPGTEYEIGVSCFFATHRFKKGNRIRVAVSESLWPMVWPSPYPVTLNIVAGESRVLLPVRVPEAVERPIPIPLIRNAVEERVAKDLKVRNTKVSQPAPNADGLVTIRKDLPEPPRTYPDIGTTLSGASVWDRSIREGDPNSSVWSVDWTREIKRDDWNVKTRSTVELTSTATHFRVKESIRAWDGSGFRMRCA